MARRASLWRLRAPVLLLAAALLAATPSAFAQAPHLVARDGDLVLTALPPLLADEAIERQLTSGLTTGFVFALEVGRQTLGTAKVDVRYELWDEIFLVARLEAGQPGAERSSVESRAALDRWWADLTLRLGELPAADLDASGEGVVHLTVVPFSQDEETETRLWFAESVRRAERTDTGGGSVGGSSGLDRVLTTLIGTSIRRRPLVEYRWQVALPRRREAAP